MSGHCHVTYSIVVALWLFSGRAYNRAWRMRLGKPFVPVLKQRHGSNGRERPGERLSSGRQAVERPKQEAWNEVSLSHDELSSSAPLSARSSVASTRASSLTRTARRSNRGVFNSKVGKVAGCSSSTGGTGSGTGLGGVSALSSFWSNIDNLDQDLQHRAAQLNGRGRISSRCAFTPTETTFPITPDMSSKDVSFAETPETNDMFFVDGPEVSFFDHRGITDAEFVSMEGSLNLDDCSGSQTSILNKAKNNESPSNWLADLPVATSLLEGSTFEAPSVRSALSSPDVSSTAFRDSPQALPRNAKPSTCRTSSAQRSFQTNSNARRPSLGTGVRTPRGSGSFGLSRGAGRLPSGGKGDAVISGSKGDAVVDQLTRRIRQLEGELEQAVDALESRQTSGKRSPRRSGSAPPARRHQANHIHGSNMPSPVASSLLTGSPQATPRIMCRETLTETEGSQGLDPGAFMFTAAQNTFPTVGHESESPSPTRLAHICQMMQAERKCFLDTLRAVCNEVGVPIESEDSQAQWHDTLQQSAPNTIASPSILLSRLRETHLALRARVPLGESAERPQNSASAEDGAFTSKEPPQRTHAESDTSFAMRPLSGAITALRTVLLDADDIRKAYDDLSVEDRGDLKELAKCIAKVDSKLFGDCGLLSGSSEVAIPLAETLAVDKSLRERTPSLSSVPEVSTLAQASAEPPSGQSLTRSSPQSSCGSLPAVGRLSELVDEKQREVAELQERCDRACASSEEHLEASTLLASSREELRLLREFLGTSSEGAAEPGSSLESNLESGMQPYVAGC